MILEAAISTIGTLVAAGYAAHRIENMLLARRGGGTPNSGVLPPPQRPKPPLAVEPWTLDDARRQAQAFVDMPSCFWLDPNFFGDFPDWREKLLAPPPKPKGEIDPMKEVAVAFGEVRMRGNTLHNSFRMVTEPTTLPCGCVGGIDDRDQYVTRCRTCHATWEARSNDPSRRSLAQGEKVHYHGPQCPKKHGKPRTVLTEHAGEPTSWRCECSIEFTRQGETKSSRTRRKRLANRDDYDNELPLPPRIG